jgi:GTPase involved in cell partitioning and DNA repair
MDRSMVMADIPGLIEGAHQGAGLGHEFLRHVERTRALVHLVEPSPTDGSDPIENYRAIRKEVEQYDVDLASRPEIIAVSKGELPGAQEVRERLDQETGREVMLFSSVTGEGLNALMSRKSRLLPRRAVGRRMRCSANPTSLHKIKARLQLSSSGSLRLAGTGPASTGNPKLPERSRMCEAPRGGGRSWYTLPSPLPNPPHRGEGTGGILK